LLFAQGICLGATTRAFPDWLAQVRTGDGRELPRQLKDRLLREFERLQLLVRQIRALERQRAAFFRQALRAQTHDQLPGWQPVAAELRQFCGIGEGAALTLATELFGWRELKNRRQVAALTGLAPSPWQSGESVDEEQGISKAGRGPLRALLVEIAWGWLRYQMESSLSQWFMTRFAHGNSRQRRIGIVALARKLLVALWKFVHTGELPEGVRLTKNPYQFSYTPSLE
jgi:transposase